MKGILFDEGGLAVADDLTLRDLRAGDVRIEIQAAGVCHSDVSVIDGTIPFPTPVVLGHEGAGVVTEVGPGVDHVAVGDHVVIANSAALAGHVIVESHAIVGGLAGIHQFTRVGESAMCGAGAMVSQDVPPFCTASGDRARLYGLNLIGLKRRGISDASVRALKRAYRILFLEPGTRQEALRRTREALGTVAEVARLVAFVDASERGVCRP